MPAFQPYGGGYEYGRARYSWRCYATTRIYELRLAEHAPFPTAPDGMKWACPVEKDERVAFGCLVDEMAEEFSQILVQVDSEAPQPATPPVHVPRPADHQPH